nr:MAG: hypothetical protein [Microviridae sp.]
MKKYATQLEFPYYQELARNAGIDKYYLLVKPKVRHRQSKKINKKSIKKINNEKEI